MLHSLPFFALCVPLALLLERCRSLPWRNALLLMANAGFLYLFSPSVLALSFLLAASAFTIGLIISRQSRSFPRTLFLGLGLLLLVAPVLLKPERFLAVDGAAKTISFSFFCLPLIAYLIDLFLRRIEPARNLPAFLAFTTFFPTLISGPIRRLQGFEASLAAAHGATPLRSAEAAQLILLGLFKKLVLADRIGELIRALLAGADNGQNLLLLPYFHLLMAQTYLDFSAYTDIARGVSLALGFEVPLNFQRPLLARNPIDFWRRWHISFSQWMRDYVYYPCFFATKSLWLAFFLTFFLNGVWHAPERNFVLLGLFWGLMVSLYLFSRPLWDRLPLVLQILLMQQVFAASFLFFDRAGLSLFSRGLNALRAADLPALRTAWRAARAALFLSPGNLALLAAGATLYPALRYLFEDARREQRRAHFAILLFSGISLLYAFSLIRPTASIYGQF